MDDPKPRFTGIFLPVEILDKEELTLLDQVLLSWIDALFCKEHGGCFAKNDYLAKRLHVKENTIAKSIMKLRHMGLIEDISFDGRNRVMRATIGRHVDQCQSNAGLDLNPMQGLTKIQPSVGFKSNATYIERKEERKEEDTSSASLGLFDFFFSSLQSINPKIKAPNGKAWRIQLQQMMDEDGRSEDEIRKVIDYIVEQHNTSDAEFTWSKAVQSAEKLRKHFATIWLEMSKRKGKKPKDEAMEEEIKRYEENKNWVVQVYKKNIDLIKKSGNMFNISDNVVWMKNGNSFRPLGYDESGFKEQVTSFLRKNNLWNP